MSDDALVRLAPAEAGSHAAEPPAWQAESRELSRRWSDWVADHRLPAAFLAGLIATHMATVIGFWLPSIGLPRLDWNLTNGAVFLPHASTGVQFLAGGIFHYTNGIALSVMFAILLHHVLPWPTTAVGNVLKGLLFGTILSVITCVWMLPRVYLPHADAGFFSVNLGWKVIVGVFVWHWVYGLHLGVIFNPASRQQD